MIAAYDMIDRFLRNNLNSNEDYAEYLAALESLIQPKSHEPQEHVECMCGIFKLGKREPLTDEKFLEMILRTGTVELVGACTFVGGSIQMQGKIGLLRSAKIIKEFVEAAHGIGDEA